jgi:hypothetical protein
MTKLEELKAAAEAAAAVLAAADDAWDAAEGAYYIELNKTQLKKLHQENSDD